MRREWEKETEAFTTGRTGKHGEKPGPRNHRSETRYLPQRTPRPRRYECRGARRCAKNQKREATDQKRFLSATDEHGWTQIRITVSDESWPRNFTKGTKEGNDLPEQGFSTDYFTTGTRRSMDETKKWWPMLLKRKKTSVKDSLCELDYCVLLTGGALTGDPGC